MIIIHVIRTNLHVIVLDKQDARLRCINHVNYVCACCRHGCRRRTLGCRTRSLVIRRSVLAHDFFSECIPNIAERLPLLRFLSFSLLAKDQQVHAISFFLSSDNCPANCSTCQACRRLSSASCNSSFRFVFAASKSALKIIFATPST